MNKILIIEDNLVLCRMLCNWLERKGLKTEHTSSALQARKLIAGTDAAVILSDIRLPDGDGVELLEWMNRQGFSIPFIVMTDYAEVSSAVRAMKLGAEDYLPKPVVPEKLYSLIDGILCRRQREDRKAGACTPVFHRESPKIKEMERLVRLVAPTTISVLVRGDNGTGKEYVAHSIHRASKRADKPFVAVDCGAIPEELAASEFFGHAKGAFTGAADSQDGVLKEAEGGTLFLDEAGNLPYKIQTLLLRALQERRYRPVGGKQELNADVRIIAATNEELEKAIGEGRFREDLYHRLAEFTIPVPRLAECPEDILPLAEFFREESCREFEKEVSGFDADARHLLQTYPWWGNVRELKHKVRGAVLLAGNGIIGTEELRLDRTPGGEGNPFVLKDEKEEKERIVRALEAANNNKALAAELLQIGRRTLYDKLKKYGIR